MLNHLFEAFVILQELFLGASIRAMVASAPRSPDAAELQLLRISQPAVAKSIRWQPTWFESMSTTL
jgi:hypothetical protein